MQTLQPLSAPPEPAATGPAVKLAQLPKNVARRAHRKLAGPLHLAYPGAADEGPYFAEIYLTWFFGRGTVMWRVRFDTEESARLAAEAHAQFLDDQLPRFYWAEDWSGRPYKERHEYGISWGVGEATFRAQEDLAPVSRTALPGYENTN